MFIKRNTKHGMSRTRAYRTWGDMLQRCRDRTNPYYGGRERPRPVTVCQDWLSFENFYADMGDPPPGLSLDRIDNDGPYAPWNCQWATQSVQNANRRRPKLKTKRKPARVGKHRAADGFVAPPF
jgi:hypothetical protein